jgi:hypothetical protein
MHAQPRTTRRWHAMRRPAAAIGTAVCTRARWFRPFGVGAWGAPGPAAGVTAGGARLAAAAAGRLRGRTGHRPPPMAVGSGRPGNRPVPRGGRTAAAACRCGVQGGLTPLATWRLSATWASHRPPAARPATRPPRRRAPPSRSSRRHEPYRPMGRRRARRPALEWPRGVARQRRRRACERCVERARRTRRWTGTVRSVSWAARQAVRLRFAADHTAPYRCQRARTLAGILIVRDRLPRASARPAPSGAPRGRAASQASPRDRESLLRGHARWCRARGRTA